MQVNEILSLPTATVRILLTKFKWDTETLMQRYLEDRAKFFEDTGLPRALKGAVGGGFGWMTGRRTAWMTGWRTGWRTGLDCSCGRSLASWRLLS